jgi:hypothetical protein
MECPNRLQLSEKFLEKYVVSALPQSNQANCAPTTKNTGRQCKRHPAKIPANQSTMDQYVEMGGAQ